MLTVYFPFQVPKENQVQKVKDIDDCFSILQPAKFVGAQN